MTTGAPGAVFFLGSRAHYQVLQQPEPQFDAENGNAEVFQNSLTAEYNGGYSVLDDGNVPEDNDKDSLKRRSKRRPSATTDEMKPAQLNDIVNDNAAKEKGGRRSLLAFLRSLARRKKRCDLQYLQHVERVLTTCTYRECCRCLDCQSSYFDCDLDDEYVESDDDSEYNLYAQQLQRQEESDDDEVFAEKVPSDSTSTDVLLESKKMSVSSDGSEDPETMNLEVAAGTPLLLNFLLTHPITCSIQ